MRTVRTLGDYLTFMERLGSEVQAQKVAIVGDSASRAAAIAAASGPEGEPKAVPPTDRPGRERRPRKSKDSTTTGGFALASFVRKTYFDVEFERQELIIPRCSQVRLSVCLSAMSLSVYHIVVCLPCLCPSVISVVYPPPGPCVCQTRTTLGSCVYQLHPCFRPLCHTCSRTRTGREHVAVLQDPHQRGVVQNPVARDCARLHVPHGHLGRLRPLRHRNKGEVVA